jgi:gamma-glutamylcyclotransferase (GGCT)/AIG2-like uncharacterized protein YtfP
MLLFVYGSLKKGLPLDRYLRDATFINTAEISGFTLYSARYYPVMFFCGDPNAKVVGELYEIDDVSHIDRIELSAGYSRGVIAKYNGEEVQSYYYEEIRPIGFSVWSGYERRKRQYQLYELYRL